MPVITYAQVREKWPDGLGITCWHGQLADHAWRLSHAVPPDSPLSFWHHKRGDRFVFTQGHPDALSVLRFKLSATSFPVFLSRLLDVEAIDFDKSPTEYTDEETGYWWGYRVLRAAELVGELSSRVTLVDVIRPTAGPWWLDGDSIVCGDSNVPHHVAAVTGGDGCRYVDDDLLNAECAANARLIAKSPDMLAVLEELVEFWDNGTPIQPGAEIVADVRAILRHILR